MKSAGFSPQDQEHMRLAIRLAGRGRGTTSPNPMVGAVLVKNGRLIGQGWHRKAGEPHAEINAIENARKHGQSTKQSTLYVTLEPCSTHGRTPPCTEAIAAAGIRRVIFACLDPNPAHAGRASALLRKVGIEASHGLCADEARELIEAFGHWVQTGLPFVTLKAAMTLDGKIATASGQSKWITGIAARKLGMQLRGESDAILVGVNTIIADDPSLTCRNGTKDSAANRPLRRIILDSNARTPPGAKVVADASAGLTTIVVGKSAPKRRVSALASKVCVLVAPTLKGRISLRWLLRKLGREMVVQLLVEGGGEIHASFLEQRLAQRICFFYAPLIIGGRASRKAVAGKGLPGITPIPNLQEVKWKRAGEDLVLTARINYA